MERKVPRICSHRLPSASDALIGVSQIANLPWRGTGSRALSLVSL